MLLMNLYRVKITESQRMALLDVLSFYSRDRSQPQRFHDVVRDTTTEVGELLRLIMDADPFDTRCPNCLASLDETTPAENVMHMKGDCAQIGRLRKIKESSAK